MSGKILSQKVHRDRTQTVIRVIEDPQPVRRTGNPLSRLMESCRQVEAAAARIQAAVKPSVKPGAKPTLSELASGIVASKRRGYINRFARHTGGAAVVSQRQVVTKAAAPQPKPYEPDEGAVTALRAAFGLGTRREQVQDTRKAMVEDHRAAKARKDAASAKPEILNTPAGAPGHVQIGPLTTGNASGAPFEPMANASVWMAIHQLFVQGERNPVSVDVNELARMTGLTPAQVRASIEALLATGQLQREPGRAGSALTRVTPVL